MRHLVILAKAPHLGAVKRRLGNDIGSLAALQFYERNLRSTLRRLSRDRRWRTSLAITGAPTRWSNVTLRTVHIMEQGHGDLGDRMRRVMEAMPSGPVIIIGSDIPNISRNDIYEAFSELGQKDIVLGPAHDGGFWLIGQARRRPLPAIFRNVRWSSQYTLNDTLANLDHRHTYSLIRKLLDVDDGKSYEIWRKTGKKYNL